MDLRRKKIEMVNQDRIFQTKLKIYEHFYKFSETLFFISDLILCYRDKKHNS